MAKYKQLSYNNNNNNKTATKKSVQHPGFQRGQLSNRYPIAIGLSKMKSRIALLAFR